MGAPESNKTGKEVAQAKTLMVEWRVADEEELDGEWPPVQRTFPATSAPPPIGRWRWWALATGALLLILAAGGWLWQQAHAGLGQIEGELQAEVEAGQWRTHQDRRMNANPRGLVQESAPGEDLAGNAHVQLLDVRKDWAIVQVTTTQGEIAFRQTRFYRKGARGWYAAPPNAALWGAPHTLETPYFVFRYYAHDSEAVAAAAIKVGALYPDFAVSYPRERAVDHKVEIWVSPEYPLLGTFNRSSEAALEIASPAIYLAPVALSEGDILAQAVLLEVLERLGNAAVQPQAMPQTRVFLRALALWHLWSSELPLAALYKPTVQWLYSDVQGERSALAFDAKLCPLHQLWRDAPNTLQIPLFCGVRAQEEYFELGRFPTAVAPRTLAQLNIFTTAPPHEGYTHISETEIVALATLIDYATTTYGRQSLARLIANGASLSTWETLIPASFGVSSSEFERGWQATLRDHFAVSVATVPQE